MSFNREASISVRRIEINWGPSRRTDRRGGRLNLILSWQRSFGLEYIPCVDSKEATKLLDAWFLQLLCELLYRARLKSAQPVPCTVPWVVRDITRLRTCSCCRDEPSSQTFPSSYSISDPRNAQLLKNLATRGSPDVSELTHCWRTSQQIQTGFTGLFEKHGANDQGQKCGTFLWNLRIEDNEVIEVLEIDTGMMIQKFLRELTIFSNKWKLVRYVCTCLFTVFVERST